MPVAMDQIMLIAQHFQHRLILFFGELIRITDAQLWLRGFDEQRGIRNVDRAIKACTRPLLLLPSGRFCSTKPCQLSGGVGKVLVLYISRFGPPLVRCIAVNFAANVKPVAFNHARIERFPVGNQGGIGGARVCP